MCIDKQDSLFGGINRANWKSFKAFLDTREIHFQ